MNNTDLSELERLRIERDYLLARADRAGSLRFGLDRDTGVSSNALVRYAITGVEPERGDYPSDPSDLSACYNARDNAPAHLQPTMDPMLERFREAVGQRYPEVLEEGWLEKRKGVSSHGIPLSEFANRIHEFMEDGSEKPAPKAKAPSRKAR